MRQLALTRDGNFLVDSSGIRFRRPPLLAVIEVKMQSGWIPPYSRDFQQAVKGTQANSYCDLGCIRHTVDDHHFDDGTPVSAYYEIHAVELYHVGE